MNRFSLFFQLFFLLCTTVVSAEDIIQVYYEERTPYAVTGPQGDVSGLTATPTENAFRHAGINFQWKKMPFKRQLQTIKYNKKIACGIGWFKKPEREAFALFTNVIYQDRPSITISKQGNEIVAKHDDVSGLLNDKSLKLLVKDDFSYGSYIDALIDRYAPERVVVGGSNNIQMLQMLLSGRADYFFVSEEEAEELITSAGQQLDRFQTQHYSDMPAGNKRYIACSQQVTEEKVELLNQALGE